ncbi:MAG: F0F1 ATP synthase subunit A [Deltaproteobacteria bacterium]|nr:F0F1 ATP synthase subunit A [Deltaproteobacteria bacterium]
MSSETHVADAAAAGAQEIALELPTFLHLLGVDMHHEYFGYSLHQWFPVLMSLSVGLVLVGFSLWATRKMEKIPRGSQAFVEIVVEGLYNFFGDTLGKNTTRYLPLCGTLFLYILLMNLWGLIPSLHSPTNQINTTLPMALTVFVFYNVEAIRRKGLSYFKHFFEPLIMAPIMFPLHVIGEFVRPLSLSIRLFGNLTGEDLTIALLVGLTPFVFGIIPVPIHLVMVLMALLFSTIQATIFSLLTAVYLSLALEEEEH